jgi:alkylhydroperoxidase family enzyme
VTEGSAATEDERTATIVRFAEKANADPAAIDDGDVEGLRKSGLTDKGVVQLVHLVSDFAAYNRLNIALGTDYDYRDMWREIAFGWQPGAGDAPGDNTRGLPT